MSINKYYHKIVHHDTYFIDSLYINYSLPSLKLKNLKYGFDSMEYINHDIWQYNPLTQNNEPTPYPSKLEIENHPYWFVRKFLSFMLNSIKSSLDLAQNNIDEKHTLAWLTKVKRLSPNILKHEHSQGVRVSLGDNHNILIQFDGQFFIHKKLNKDIEQLKRVGSFIHQVFAMHFLQIKEWREIAMPRPTIYQLHFAENLTGRRYKSIRAFRPKYPTSSKFQNKIENNSHIRQGPWHIPSELNSNIKTDIITGFILGIPGQYQVAVYDKSHDKEESKLHSELRFGSCNYWRREFRVGTKKLRACQIHYFAEFLIQFKCATFRSNVIRKCRKTGDILVKGDNKTYLKFHDNSLKLSKKERDQVSNKFRFHNKPFIRMNIKSIPNDLIKSKPWNPYKNIVGNLNSKKSKNMTPEQIIKLSIRTINLSLQNARNSFDNQSNKQELINIHDEGLKIINDLKNYGKFFNIYQKEQKPFNIDEFIAGSLDNS